MGFDISKYRKTWTFFYGLIKYWLVSAWVELEAIFYRPDIARMEIQSGRKEGFPTITFCGEISLQKKDMLRQIIKEAAERTGSDVLLTYGKLKKNPENLELLRTYRVLNLFWYEDVILDFGDMKIGISCFRGAKGEGTLYQILRRKKALERCGAQMTAAYVEKGDLSFKAYSGYIKLAAKGGYKWVAGLSAGVYRRRNMRTWDFSETSLFYSLGKISDKMKEGSFLRASVLVKIAVDKKRKRIARQGYFPVFIKKDGKEKKICIPDMKGENAGQFFSEQEKSCLHSLQKKMKGLRLWEEMILLKDIFRYLDREIPERFTFLGEYSVNYICSRTIELAPGNVFFFRQQFRDKNDTNPDSEVLRLKLVFRALMRKTLFIFSYRPLLPWIPHIVIEDCREAHITVMGQYRKRLKARFVGITGSVGKTSAKDMLYETLSEQFRTEKSSRNSNVQIRIGINLQKIQPETEIFIQEIGGGRPGGAARHSRMIAPDVAVITNIGTAHLGNFESQQDLMQHKLGIAAGLRENGILFLNGDDPLLAQAEPACQVCRFAVYNKEADYYAEDIREIGNQTFFYIVGEEGRWPAVLNVLGTYNVLNAVCCFAIGRYFGMEPEDIIRGIGKFRTSGTRQNLVYVGGYALFVDCFNASLDSVESSLAVLKKMEIGKGKKKNAIIGDVSGMGEKTEEINRRIAEVLSSAAADLDRFVLYGDNGLEIRKMMTGQLTHVEVIQKKEALNRWMEENIERGDITLFKGSSKTKLDERIDDVYGTNFADGKYVEESRFSVRKHGGVRYRLFKDYSSATGVYDRKQEIKIKDRFGKKPVKKICVNGWKEDSHIRKIIFGKYVRHIGSRAFFRCRRLREAVWPENLRFIGRNAFAGCEDLRGVNLGKNLKALGPGAFRNCRSIEMISIPGSCAQIAKEAFYGCSALRQVRLEEGVQQIGDLAFAECRRLKEIRFPDSLRYVGKDAFQNCESLTRVYVGPLTKVHREALSGCQKAALIRRNGDFPHCGGLANERRTVVK